MVPWNFKKRKTVLTRHSTFTNTLLCPSPDHTALRCLTAKWGLCSLYMLPWFPSSPLNNPLYPRLIVDNTNKQPREKLK